MKQLFALCAFPLLATLTSCTTSDMEAMAARIHSARVNSALQAQGARVRVWKDTSTLDDQGWHLHSDQKEHFILPENEFKTARDLMTSQGYTCHNSPVTTAQPATSIQTPPCIVELEWTDKNGETLGGMNMASIIPETKQDSSTVADFPLVLPEEAHQQLFALPSIKQALQEAAK